MSSRRTTREEEEKRKREQEQGARRRQTNQGTRGGTGNGSAIAAVKEKVAQAQATANKNRKSTDTRANSGKSAPQTQTAKSAGTQTAKNAGTQSADTKNRKSTDTRANSGKNSSQTKSSGNTLLRTVGREAARKAAENVSSADRGKQALETENRMIDILNQARQGQNRDVFIKDLASRMGSQLDSIARGTYFSPYTTGALERAGLKKYYEQGRKENNPNTPAGMVKSTLPAPQLDRFFLQQELKDKSYGLGKEKLDPAALLAATSLDPLSAMKADAQTKAPYFGRAVGARSKAWDSGLTDKEKVKAGIGRLSAQMKQDRRQRSAANQTLSRHDNKLRKQFQQEIKLAKADFDSARARGDAAGMQAAHQRAETWRRIEGGYSGGATGMEHIVPKLDQSDISTLNKTGQKQLRSAKLGYENAQTDAERARYAAMGQDIRRNPAYQKETYDRGAYRETDANGRMRYAGTAEERAKEAEQGAAIPKAIGTGIAGSFLSLPGTTARALQADAARNQSRLQALSDIRGGGQVNISEPERLRTGQEILAGLRNSERYQNANAISRTHKLARAMQEIKNEVPLGQRLLNRSDIYRAQATEGQTGLNRYLTEALITGGEMVPGLAATALTGGMAAPGLAIMGAQAAGRRMGELEGQGEDPVRAFNRGLATGLIEAATERVPLGNLTKIAKGGGKSFARNMLTQALEEVGTEELSEVGNYAADRAFGDKNASLTAKDLRDTAVISLLTSLGMGAGAGIVGSRRTGRTAEQTGAETRGRTEAESGPVRQEETPSAEDRIRAREAQLQAREKDLDGREQEALEQMARNTDSDTYYNHFRNKLAQVRQEQAQVRQERLRLAEIRRQAEVSRAEEQARQEEAERFAAESRYNPERAREAGAELAEDQVRRVDRQAQAARDRLNGEVRPTITALRDTLRGAAEQRAQTGQDRQTAPGLTPLEVPERTRARQAEPPMVREERRPAVASVPAVTENPALTEAVREERGPEAADLAEPDRGQIVQNRLQEVTRRISELSRQNTFASPEEYRQVKQELNELLDERKRLTSEMGGLAFRREVDTQGDRFRQWFKNSRVTQPDGAPKIMYHGTSQYGFDEFDPYSSSFGLFGYGAYFTEDPSVAESYTKKGKGQTPGVYSAYLSIQNPIDMDAPANLDEWIRAFRASGDLDVSYLRELEGQPTNEDCFRALKENLADLGYYKHEGEETASGLLQAMGYDGITHIGGGRVNKQDPTRHRVYIAFDDDQIQIVSGRPFAGEEGQGTAPQEAKPAALTPNLTERETGRQEREAAFTAEPEYREAYDRTAEDRSRQTREETDREEARRTEEEEPYSVGAAPGGFDPYSRMANEYGTIEPGENPARMVDVPLSTNGEDRVSKAARTFMEAGLTSEATQRNIERDIVRGMFSHNVKGIEETVDRAYDYLDHNGLEAAEARWDNVVRGRIKTTEDELALGMALWANAERTGKADRASALAAQIAAEGTTAGRMVNIYRMLKRATPEGRVYYARKMYDKIQEDLNKKYGKKAPKLEANEELLEDYRTAETEKERFDTLDRIYEDVARQMPRRIGDIVNAWRYFAMLGNPRTHIRNVVGNVLFGELERASGKVSAAMQKAILPQEQRTRSLTTTREARDFAARDADEMEQMLRGDKYDSDFQGIQRKVQERALGPFSFLSKGNSRLLSWEDFRAKRRVYRRSMAGYITARGWDPANLTTAQLEQARGHAYHDAQVATFQEENRAASAISRLEQTNSVTKVLIGGLVPYKNVPLNIAKQGMAYSPMGALTSGIKLHRALEDMKSEVRTGNKTAAEAIDGLAKGLTGSSILALGIILAAKGLLTAGGTDDDDLDELETAQGGQEYALKIGDHSYTLDWAAPSALPLFMGAEAYNIGKELFDAKDGEEGEEAGNANAAERSLNLLNTVLSSATRFYDPMFNMTVLSGLSGAINSAAYGENQAAGVLVNALQNYGGQFVPTLLGQVNRTFFDDTRRTTFVDKNEDVDSSWQRFVQRQTNKIPGLSQKNMPYLDVWGRESRQENGFLRAFENFLSPGYLKKAEDSEVSDELKRLHEAGFEDVLPTKPKASATIAKEHLNKDQYEARAKAQGKTALDLLTEAMKGEAYQGMTDEEKAAYVASIFDYAKEKGKEAAGGEVTKKVAALEQAAKDHDIGVSALLQASMTIDSTGDADGNGSVNTEEAWNVIKDMDGPEALKRAAFDVYNGTQKDYDTYQADAEEKARVQADIDKYFSALPEEAQTAIMESCGGNLSSFTQEEAYNTIKSLGLPADQEESAYNGINAVKGWTEKGQPRTWASLSAKQAKTQEKADAKDAELKKYFSESDLEEAKEVDAYIESNGGYFTSLTDWGKNMAAMGVPKAKWPGYYKYANARRGNKYWHSSYEQAAKDHGW